MPAARGIYARMAMLVEAIAGPGASDLAESFALPGDAWFEVRHRAEQTVLTLGTEGGAAGIRAEVGWRRGGAVAQVHATLAGMDPAAWPRGAPLELLLPDARSLETRCNCQGKQPCRHALVALYAFAQAAEADPSLLCRDARRKAEALGDRPGGGQVSWASPRAPSPAQAFWLYAPPPSQLTADARDFPPPPDGDPFHEALLEAMRAVRMRLG